MLLYKLCLRFSFDSYSFLLSLSLNSDPLLLGLSFFLPLELFFLLLPLAFLLFMAVILLLFESNSLSL